jgi:hypothetical protein
MNTKSLSERNPINWILYLVINYIQTKRNIHFVHIIVIVILQANPEALLQTIFSNKIRVK